MKWPGAFVALAMHLSVPNSGLSFAPSTGAASRSRSSCHHPHRSVSSEAPASWHRKRSCVYTMSPRDRQKKQALYATSNNWFSQFWRTNIADKNGDTLGAAKEKLKERLLDVVRSTERGISTSEEQRQDIDELIAALEPFNPNAKAVTSESLSALWILEWTTEKEIIFLMESGLPWKPSGPVQQEIDVDAKTLSNRMLFGDDSVFEVFSSIDPENSGPRVNFEFKACKLTYGGFTLPLPPVGKGWFESVYLDQDLRVTRDVRGDVTVLVKSQSQE